MSGSVWHDAGVTGDLSCADFSATQPSSVMFDGTNLANAKFTGFSSFTLGVNFSQVNLTNVDFRSSTLNSAKFQYVTVTDANFTSDSIVSSDLSETDFSRATLAGMTWTNTICPDGTNNDDHSNTYIGHLVP